jgi:hypothetical protein
MFDVLVSAERACLQSAYPTNVTFADNVLSRGADPISQYRLFGFVIRDGDGATGRPPR